jgi:hypothetical protein
MNGPTGTISIFWHTIQSIALLLNLHGCLSVVEKGTVSWLRSYRAQTFAAISWHTLPSFLRLHLTERIHSSARILLLCNRLRIPLHCFCSGVVFFPSACSRSAGGWFCTSMDAEVTKKNRQLPLALSYIQFNLSPSRKTWNIDDRRTAQGLGKRKSSSIRPATGGRETAGCRTSRILRTALSGESAE